jgi:hypothetical protein
MLLKITILSCIRAIPRVIGDFEANSQHASCYYVNTQFREFREYFTDFVLFFGFLDRCLTFERKIKKKQVQSKKNIENVQKSTKFCKKNLGIGKFLEI